MANYNRVILIGNLTRDPELRYLPSNTAVCEFGMAVNRRRRDREGNTREDVCFIDISAFGKPGEIINQYMRRGQPMLVEGHLRYDTWTGQDGQKRSKHSVVVENFQFLGGRGDGPSEGGGGYQQRGDASASGSGRQDQRDDQPPPPTDDDIPF